MAEGVWTKWSLSPPPSERSVFVVLRTPAAKTRGFHLRESAGPAWTELNALLCPRHPLQQRGRPAHPEEPPRRQQHHREGGWKGNGERRWAGGGRRRLTELCSKAVGSPLGAQHRRLRQAMLAESSLERLALTGCGGTFLLYCLKTACLFVCLLLSTAACVFSYTLLKTSHKLAWRHSCFHHSHLIIFYILLYYLVVACY